MIMKKRGRKKQKVVIKKGLAEPYDGLSDEQRRRIAKSIFEDKYGKNLAKNASTVIGNKAIKED